jgi:hypothetical protein
MSSLNNVYWDSPNLCPAIMNSRGVETDFRPRHYVFNDLKTKTGAKTSEEFRRLLQKEDSTFVVPNLSNFPCAVDPQGEIVINKEINLTNGSDRSFLSAFSPLV